jgi:hypothetical protein
MEEGRELILAPEPPAPLFGDGDMVHVFEGTGDGKEGWRNVGWFGKVVGRKVGAY